MKAIILSGIPWNSTWQRHHKISKWLKDLGYEVTFIEAIPSSKFTLKKVISKLKGKINSSTKINNKKVVKVINGHFYPSNSYFNLLNKNKVNKLIKKIGCDFDLIVNYLPIYTTKKIIEKVDYKFLIYDCVRDFSNWGGYPKSVIKYEKMLKNKSNLILTDSYYLTEKLDGYQILPSLSNGQYQVFKNKTRPDIIKKIVYFGGIGNHIDIDVLKELSKKYEIHLIGKYGVKLDFDYIDHGYFNDPIELAKEIIKYDAIIIPYKGNMDGVIPAKFVESIGSNLPVFINSFYDSEKLKDICYVYKDINDLLEQIKNYDKKDFNQNIIDKFIIDNIEENQFTRFSKLLRKE